MTNETIDPISTNIYLSLSKVDLTILFASSLYFPDEALRTSNYWLGILGTVKCGMFGHRG